MYTQNVYFSIRGRVVRGLCTNVIDARMCDIPFITICTCSMIVEVIAFRSHFHTKRQYCFNVLVWNLPPLLSLSPQHCKSPKLKLFFHTYCSPASNWITIFYSSVHLPHLSMYCSSATISILIYLFVSLIITILFFPTFKWLSKPFYTSRRLNSHNRGIKKNSATVFNFFGKLYYSFA
jgi:hypothetical protein